MKITPITYIFLPLSLIVFCVSSCAKKTFPRAEVYYVSNPETGVMMLKANGVGPNVTEAQINAEENAFKVLLFRGVPGSPQPNAIFANEAEIKKSNADYFKELFEKGLYKTFVVKSKILSAEKLANKNRVKMENGKTAKVSVVSSVAINFNAFRRNMETTGVKRRFGF